MKTHIFLTVSAALCAAAALPAAADRNLARSKGCITCHDTNTKIVGPSFKEISGKYKGEKDAPAQVSASILKGSKGKWGAIEMPPNKVTDAEAKQLAEWILSL
jgi:cytochrome c